jgi:adenylate cyclase
MPDLFFRPIASGPDCPDNRSVRGNWTGKMTRRLRIATGLVLFVYVAFHLVNVSLGLYSIDLMEAARPWFQGFWTSIPGVVLLTLAFATHAGLGLHALFWRNTLRMTRLDAIQLLTSLGIIPLLAPHVIGTAIAADLFDYDPTFQSILGLFWVDVPAEGLRQVFTLVFVWVHGVIGLFTWMRVQRWWTRVSAVLYPLAVIIPVLALLGFVHAGKELTAHEPTAVEESATSNTETAQAQPGAPTDAAAASTAREPQEEAAPNPPLTGEALQQAVATLDRIKWQVIWTFVALVALTLVARAIRMRHDRARLRISWVGGPEFTVDAGPSILQIAQMQHVPHAHLCRGRGRCGTCRVRVVASEFPLPPRNDVERQTLGRVGAEENVRLACQLVPHGGSIRVERLVRPDLRPADLREMRRQPAAPASPQPEPAE